ncbi:response regulator [Bradyrhizobium tropiciagri]|uniref:response regulator n=1 Tax=Bradyrhizobium tropiciagri TaxID=312253 RepID=UPI001BAD4A05|nr:response regulator [Bradyrhizobium tropiciagri]MBR0869017.1 response regulator [Bradyrhizobium tropiciagri]
MTGTTYSVLVVEDETMIRMMLVEMLEEIGHTVIGEAAHLEQAIDLATGINFDYAVLDINLAGRSSLPVAQIIKSRKIPFVFSTGYGADAIPTEFADNLAVRKPFTLEALRRTVHSLMTGANA